MPEAADDYMIDGIEKRVPLLPATTDIDDGGENLTPTLHELVAGPQVPQRPIRQESVESEDTDVPVIPRRPGRKMSTGSVDDGAPVIPTRPSRRGSIKSNRSVERDDDSTPWRKTTSMTSIPKTSVPQDEEPVVPPRPTRETNIKSIRKAEDQSVHVLEDELEPKSPEAVPVIPPRPRKSSIKSIPESQIEPPHTTLSPEPMIPPRPTRKPSIKSISETEDAPLPLYEPIIPPRRTRTASIKSVPETEVPAEEEPIVPPRPTRTTSIRSFPETETPEGGEPIIPPRPTRKTSQRSMASGKEPSDQGEKDGEPIAIPPRPSRTPSIKSIPESTTESMPAIPPRPSRNTSVKSFKSQQSIEEEPRISGDEHPVTPIEQVAVIPEQQKETDRSGEATGSTDTTSPIQQALSSPHQHPSIPPRPKKKDAPGDRSMSEPTPTTSNQENPAIRTAGIAALEQPAQMPIIPPRPTKSMPKVTLGQAPFLVKTEAGTSVESVENPTVSTSKHNIEPGDILGVKPVPARSSSPSEPPPSTQPPHSTIAPRETKSSSEIQTEIAQKATGSAGKPPIPARPQHKLAKQFEAAIAREKPVPPPRPAKPPVASSAIGGGVASKFAGLRAQFAKDLNQRLAKPPPPPPQKEVVHSMESEESPAREVEDTAKTEGAVKVEAVGDMRKGRARGPQRRPPTVKPIIPDGWGISTISRIFEQRREEGKEEVEKQPGETVIESGTGVKPVYVEGGLSGEHIVPADTKEVNPVVEDDKRVVEERLVQSEVAGQKEEEKTGLKGTQHVEKEAADVDGQAAVSPVLEVKAALADVEETKAGQSAPEELKTESSLLSSEEESEHFESANEEPKHETQEF